MHQPILNEEARRQLLAGLGLTSPEDLFSSVPPRLRRNADFRFELDGVPLSRAFSENDLLRYFSSLAAENRPPHSHFRGNGTYDEAIPIAALSAGDRFRRLGRNLDLRARLAGALASRIAILTGLEHVSLEHADGFDALACALEQTFATLALPERVLWILGAVPGAEAIRSLCRRTSWAFETLPVDEATGNVDTEALRRRLKEGKTPFPVVALVGFPNRHGIVEDLKLLKTELPDACQLGAISLDVGALSLFDTSAADFLVGDLQPFAAPPSISTARLPFLASRREFAHSRVAAAPHPSASARALATLSLWGGTGFWQWGETLHSRWQYFVRECEANGLPLKFRRGQNFREGLFEIPNLESRYETAITQRVWPGAISKTHEGSARGDFSNTLLICIHSKHTKTDLDGLVEVLSHDRS